MTVRGVDDDHVDAGLHELVHALLRALAYAHRRADAIPHLLFVV
jgi:hypothetical protein